jgi:VWFA-related protein
MRKILKSLIVLVLGLFGPIPSAGGLPPQGKPRETVTVTVIEVPVRILEDRRFVTGLTEADFEIFENGVRQDITGFEEISRVISPSAAARPDPGSGIPAPAVSTRRSFLLVFNVFNYTDQIGEAIDYFFGDLVRPGDRVFILVEGRFFEFENGPAAGDSRAKLKATLTRLKQKTSFDLLRAFRELDTEANRLYMILATRPAETKTINWYFAIERYYQRYRLLWEEYRSRLLDVDLNLYKDIAGKIGRLPGEKWAICFQQRNMFPVLRSHGRLEYEIERFMGQVNAPEEQVLARTFQNEYEQLQKSMDVAKNFPGQALRDLFADANITFHVLLMKSFAHQLGSDSQDYDLRDIQAEYEDTLRRISRSTGGLTEFSNAARETLKQAAAKEDRYYLVAYQPKDKRAGIERTIDVRCRRAGVEVVALKKYIGAGAPSIEISGFQARGKKIGFDVGKYGKSVLNWREVGRVLIKITVLDGESKKVFEESRGLELSKETTHLDLELKKLAAGDHYIIIEAVDLVTGGKDVFSRPIGL